MVPTLSEPLAVVVATQVSAKVPLLEQELSSEAMILKKLDLRVATVQNHPS